MDATARRRTWLIVLALAFAAEWTLLAIHPRHRQDWALENALVVVVVGALAAGRPRLSPMAWGLLFVFGSLHLVGAHYTYAEVPYDRLARTLTGHTLNAVAGLSRNGYDRFVHFAFGLLLFLPLAEMLQRAAAPRGLWRYALPAALLFALSALFEIFEWWAAALFGGDLGTAYLGTQGDVWDAQKDMLAVLIGALLAAAITAVRRRRRATAGAPRRTA